MSAISIAISVFLALASPSFGSLLARDDVAAQNCNHDFAYTWDDGLSLWQVDIVDEFTCIGGKTTFFVHGNNQGSCIYSEDHVQSLRYAFESGHQIASNSWSNVDFSSLSQSQIDIEIQRLDEAIVKILGVKPRFFRAPQGQLSASTISYIESKHGKIVVSTDSDSGDIQGGASPEGNLAFYQNLAKQGKSKPHLSRSYATTVAGVDGLDFGSAETLINAGFKLISVAECLDTNAYEAVGSYGVRDSSWTCDGSWTSPATSTTCSQTYAAAADDKTCEKIGARFGVSGLAIYLANPYLNCGDIWAYTPVCIPTVAATLPTVCVQKYTAAKGDTCSKIAGLFGVTSEELFAANTFVNCNDIWQGTSFCIPKASNPTSCVSTYTASDGDTCKKIADKYGLNTAAIRNANSFVNCDDIWAHTPICIPGKTATNTATATATTTTATTTTTTTTTSTSTTSASAAPTCASTYSAAKGDTCLKIANNFGLSEQAIKNANTFDDDDDDDEV
ncbi:Carbohydrate esterase 4 protein [Serendipita sp. 405]|nr:Carbohydrate esterase 4 protein [Serendipita sp. 397]KAG8862860.1 Carbohydrate esterase 4 protein [Serendipita sp. 405]